MRPVIKCLFGVALSGIAAAAHGEISDAEVRIGLISDLSGPYSVVGQGAEVAAEMAIKDFGGEVLGKPIRLHVRDHQVNAERAMAHARELHQEHNVDTFLEMVGSHIAIPLQHYARENNIMALHTGAATSALSGDHCSPIGVHWIYDTYALAAGTATALVQEGARKWFFITSEHPFGLSLQNDATSAILRAGGEVVGSATHPFGTKDFSAQLEAARDSGADVIALANAGEDTTATLRSAYEMGIPGEDQTIAALLVGENVPQEIGLYASRGLKLTTAYYWNFDDRTREWSERFQRRTGFISSMYTAGVYSVTTHYLKAVEAAGTDDPAAVIRKMRELPIDDMFARNASLRPDGRMVHDMYLAEVKGPGDSTRAADYYRIIRTVPGEQAFRPLEEGGCPFL